MNDIRFILKIGKRPKANKYYQPLELPSEPSSSRGVTHENKILKIIKLTRDVSVHHKK